MSFFPLWLSLPPSSSSLSAALKCQLQKPESKPYTSGRRHFQGAIVCSWTALALTKEVGNLPQHLSLLRVFSSMGVNRKDE